MDLAFPIIRLEPRDSIDLKLRLWSVDRGSVVLCMGLL